MIEERIVYVVDDDAGMRRALTRLLCEVGFGVRGFGVRGFATASEFLQQHDPCVPGCALLDLRLPDLDGLGVQRALLDQNCYRPLIFMSGYGEIGASVRAMKAGAADFLVKPFDEQELLDAVHAALDRDQHSRSVAQQLGTIRARLATLTPREEEVMRHVVDGRLNKQIASDLGIAEKTIKVHRARAMEKMGAKSLAHLVRQTVEVTLGSVSQDNDAH